MSDTNKSIEMSTRNDGKEWSYSLEKDGITKRCTVKEVENGYTVKINKYGYSKNKNGEEGEYMDETKEFISTQNPLEAENIEESISDAEALGNILQMKQAFGNFNY